MSVKIIHEHKIPKSLWILSLIYATFTFAFGVFLTSLLLMLNDVYGLERQDAFTLFAAFSALAYILPVLGGYFCDKLGFKNSAIVGLFFSGIGLLVLLLPGFGFLILGLSFFLVGNAFCTPAIWSLIGRLYHKENVARETGSTIFYVLFNIGFLFSDISSGFILKSYGKLGILVFTIPLFIGGFLMFFLRDKIKTYNEKVLGEKIIYGKSRLVSFLKIIGLSLLLVPVCYFLLSFVFLTDIILWVGVAIAFLYLIYLTIRLRKKTIKSSNYLIGFIILCIIGFAYLIIFNSEFGLLPIYAEHHLDRIIFNTTLPAGGITALDPFYCIFLGFFYSFMWRYLQKRNKNPSIPMKFSLGLILASMGYLILSLLIFIYSDSIFSVWWLFVVFFFFVSGELMVIPIGIAMSGSLAPEGKEGLLMGVWNMIMGISAVFVGFIASFTVLPKGSSLLETNMQYLKVFFILGLSIFLLGIIVFLIKKFINKLI